jgi:hypothetical protein
VDLGEGDYGAFCKYEPAYEREVPIQFLFVLKQFFLAQLSFRFHAAEPKRHLGPHIRPLD